VKVRQVPAEGAGVAGSDVADVADVADDDGDREADVATIGDGVAADEADADVGKEDPKVPAEELPPAVPAGGAGAAGAQAVVASKSATATAARAGSTGLPARPLLASGLPLALPVFVPEFMLHSMPVPLIVVCSASLTTGCHGPGLYAPQRILR
jgi:hypothetical protein